MYLLPMYFFKRLDAKLVSVVLHCYSIIIYLFILSETAGILLCGPCFLLQRSLVSETGLLQQQEFVLFCFFPSLDIFFLFVLQFFEGWDVLTKQNCSIFEEAAVTFQFVPLPFTERTNDTKKRHKKEYFCFLNLFLMLTKWMGGYLEVYKR